MPTYTKSLLIKRRTHFLEFLKQKRTQSRVDVYMAFLKDFCGKEIYDITDKDVLNYLIFKDVNNSGRTIVHNRACPFLGGDSLKQCIDPVKCAMRHSANSMRIGIVLKLRKAFEEVGRRGNYIPTTQKGDPTKSFLVQNYITFKCQEQGEAGVLPKSAPCISRTKMDILIACILAQTTNKTGLAKVRFMQRTAIYAYFYTYIKRLAGCGWCVAPNVIRMPNNRGLVFRVTWDKTLRMESHCFGFVCMQGTDPWCAHCLIDLWVDTAKKFGLSFKTGLLFPRIDTDGTIKMHKRWRSKELKDSLERDLKRYHIYGGETPQSFRHGGTVDSLRKGKSLSKTMYLAYMKNTSTASIYARGLNHLFPDQFNWKEIGIDTSVIDPEVLAAQMQQWRAFN